MTEQWIEDAAREALVDAIGEATQEEIDRAAAIIQRHYEQAAKCPSCDLDIEPRWPKDRCPKCHGKGRIVP
jgi:Zn finger protein HypA/HybF involved in hydrogenase expression